MKLNSNKTTVIVSVSVIAILIFGVLIIRHPTDPKPVTTAAKTTTVQKPDPASEAPQGELDDSHKRVKNVVDSVSEAVGTKIPTVWERINGVKDWFLKFDTKTLAVLLICGLLLIGLVMGGKPKTQK